MQLSPEELKAMDEASGLSASEFAEMDKIAGTTQTPGIQKRESGVKLPGLLSAAGNFVAGGAERLGKGLGAAASMASNQGMRDKSQAGLSDSQQRLIKRAGELRKEGRIKEADQLLQVAGDVNKTAQSLIDQDLETIKKGKEDVIKGGVQTAATLATAGTLSPGKSWALKSAAPLSSSVLKAAGTGAATGAAAGFGQSESGNELQDTLTGGAFGGVTGGVMQGVGNKLGGKTFMGEVVPTKKAAGIEIPVELRTTANERVNKFMSTLNNLEDVELRVPRTGKGRNIQGLFNLTPTESKIFRSAETAEALANNGFSGNSITEIRKKSTGIVEGLNGFVRDAVGEASPVPSKAVARVANDVDNLLEVGMANGMTEKQASVIETMLQRSLGVDKNGTVNQIDAASLLDFQKSMQKLKSEVSPLNPHVKELRSIYQGAADAAQEAVHDAISSSPNAQAVVDAVKDPQLLAIFKSQGMKDLASKLENAKGYQDIRSAMAPFVRSNQIFNLLEDKGVKGSGVSRALSKGVGATIGSLYGAIGAVAGSIIAQALDPITETAVSVIQPKLSGSIVNAYEAARGASALAGPLVGGVMSQPAIQQGVIRSSQQPGGGGLGLNIGKVPPRYLYK